MKKIFVLVVAGLLMFTGCAKQQVRDLENVPVQEPEKSELYTNVDQYPNVVALCIHGVGFVSTTRDYTSLQESPGLTEKWCSQ
jgi:hypothetical protein